MLLYWYSIFDLNTKLLGVNESTIKKVNISIYEYLAQIKHYHNTEYSYSKSVFKKLKESEKHLVMKSLEEMEDETRSIENTKKILGLGKWSYGKGKQVFKYYKGLYESEDLRANEIKQAMSEIYLENDSTITENTNIDRSEDEVIMNEERDNFMYGEEDEQMNEEGEIIDFD